MSDYFANLTGAAIGPALRKAVERSQRHTISTGLWAVWVRAHNAYFGAAKDGHNSRSLEKKGPKGELTSFVVNHYRNLLTHYQILAAGQSPNMEPQAATGESRAETEVRAARGVLDHYMREGLEDVTIAAVEYGCVLGAGWSRLQWNTKRGEPTLPPIEPDAESEEEGEPAQLSGALEYDAFKPNDVFFEPGLRSARKFPWVIVRPRVMRYDLAADFPESEKDILAYKPSQIDLDLDLDNMAQVLGSSRVVDDDGTLFVYEFWHAKTPACPEGRVVYFLGNGKVIFEDVLPYRKMPVQRVAPADFLNSAHGYAPGWDLLGLQDYVNLTASIRATNQRAHGVGIIMSPRGADVEASQMGKGLSFLKYNGTAGKPELANFTGTPGEVVSGQKMAVEDMETISGVNSVVRGNPEASLKSGTSLALVQAQAVQMTAPVQKNIARYMSRTGEDALCIFQEYATTPVQIEIMGEGGSMVNEYSGQDIALVRRVKVSPGNPLTATPAGKMQLIEIMLKVPGAVTDVGQIWRVLETGRLDPLSQRPSRMRSNVHKENEMLARARFVTGPDGNPALQPRLGPNGLPVQRQSDGAQMMEEQLDTEALPIAMGTDDWRVHIPEHLSQLDSPEARRNPAVRRAVLWHIQDHARKTQELQMMMPALLEMAGIPPLASLMPPAPPTPGDKPGKGDGAPQGQDVDLSTKPPPGAAGMPNMPSLPPGAAMATGNNPAAPGPGGQQGLTQ